MDKKTKEQQIEEVYNALCRVNYSEREAEDQVEFFRRKRLELWEELLKLEGKI
jgi:hypothetical protein